MPFHAQGLCQAVMNFVLPLAALRSFKGNFRAGITGYPHLAVFEIRVGADYSSHFTTPQFQYLNSNQTLAGFPDVWPITTRAAVGSLFFTESCAVTRYVPEPRVVAAWPFSSVVSSICVFPAGQPSTLPIGRIVTLAHRQGLSS